uniref:EXPERA domain-containing protein n=1 Tax=Oryza rufipogon TaxID=4529 RepID=A0A0E0MQ99_ORYRU
MAAAARRGASIRPCNGMKVRAWRAETATAPDQAVVERRRGDSAERRDALAGAPPPPLPPERRGCSEQQGGGGMSAAGRRLGAGDGDGRMRGGGRRPPPLEFGCFAPSPLSSSGGVGPTELRRARVQIGRKPGMGHPHPHPYAPAELHLPGFVPLQLSQAQILVPYLATSLFLLLAVWLISGRCSRRLSDTDRWLMCWWAFTGLTHIIIEGTFVFAPNFFSNQNPSYFDEVWKEYSKGDSRYVARDPATVTVEGITAVLEGPASLLAVYAIASGKSYSHILQFTVCLGQLYGCLVYFITAYLDGFNFWTSPFYFWAYFIGANSSWVVIPTMIAIRSWKKICAAFQVEKVKTK